MIASFTQVVHRKASGFRISQNVEDVLCVRDRDRPNTKHQTPNPKHFQCASYIKYEISNRTSTTPPEAVATSVTHSHRTIDPSTGSTIHNFSEFPAAINPCSALFAVPPPPPATAVDCCCCCGCCDGGDQTTALMPADVLITLVTVIATPPDS